MGCRWVGLITNQSLIGEPLVSRLEPLIKPFAVLEVSGIVPERMLVNIAAKVVKRNMGVGTSNRAFQ